MMLNYKFSPKNEFHILAEHITGRIISSVKIHKRNTCYRHYQVHYCVNLNQYWRLSLALVFVITNEAQHDDLDEDTKFELNFTQIMPGRDAVYDFGVDNKTGVTVEMNLPVDFDMLK